MITTVDRKNRKTKIDFILPLYDEKPFTMELKKQIQICVRAVVKGFFFPK